MKIYEFVNYYYYFFFFGFISLFSLYKVDTRMRKMMSFKQRSNVAAMKMNCVYFLIKF